MLLERRKMREIVAICSCPRLGYMDFMGNAVIGFASHNVDYYNAYGAFWAQSLSEAIRGAVGRGYEYIFTTDYDSIFNAEEVGALIKLMDENEEVDAVCAVQMGRFSGLLASKEKDGISRDVLTKDLVPVDTGHFGLTLFRANAFADMEKPWFKSQPDSNGDWCTGSNKIDDDVYFWRNFKASGKKLFLAPRVVIGHLELLIKWPDGQLREMYGTMKNYREDGPPGDVWK